MQEFALPLKDDQLTTLQLPTSVTQSLLVARVPTKLIFHGMEKSKDYDELRSFFSFFDDRLCIKGIAIEDGIKYWVLRGKNSSKETSIGAIYVPIVLDPKRSTKKMDPVEISLLVLEKSFDSIDQMRRPFFFGGTDATGYTEFSHPKMLKSSSSWQKSSVLYTSIGGDALLVKSDGATAWLQLETHEIIPAGSVRDAIDRYIQSTLEDREFSSWTDQQR